jgi:protocatechuate 3,4-dioxygenase beta subunit
MEVSSHPLLDGAWPSTRTDSQGRYELAGILAQADAVLLRASAPGHRSLVVSCEDLATIASRDWDFTLARCVSVTGRVRAAGTPCEAAWVSIGDWPGGAAQAWCDAEGRFALTRVATGRQHVWVWRRGFAQLRHDVDVQAGMAGIDVELGPSHSVAGLVLGPDGAPVPWAFVDALDASDAKPPAFAGFQARTDAEGRFRLADFPAARIALRVSARGCEPLTQEVALDRDDLVLQLAALAPAPVAGAPPQPPASVVPVTAASGNTSLRGRLLDLAGNAVGGEEIELAAVTAERKPSPEDLRHATTDAAGEFLFEGLPAGSFDARWVRKEGGQVALDLETRLTLAEGETGEVELRPDGKTTLRGAIEFLTQLPPGHAYDGEPPLFGPPPGGMPPVFPLRLIPFGSGVPGPTGRRGGFAHDGRFELEGLPAGEWIIEASIQFPDGKRARGFTRITLPASGAIEVELGVLNAL